MKRTLMLALFAIVLSAAFAGTHTYSAPSGPLGLSTAITLNPSVTIAPASPRPGDTVNVTFSVSSAYFGTSFSATLSSPPSAGYVSGGSGQTGLNFLDQSTFNTRLNWYNTYGYSDPAVGSGKIKCVDINAATCGYLTSDFVTASNYGLKTVTYYEAAGSTSTPHSGGADVAGYCYGTWYVNGVNTGISLGSGTQTVRITIPSNANSSVPYPISVDASYSCLFAAKELYSSPPSEIIFLYYTANTFHDNATVNITLGCNDTAGIRIDSITSPITLNNRVNGTASATIVIRNNGTVPATLNTIVPSVGTFTPSISLPATIAPGSTLSVSGTYAYAGTLNSPISVTFTAYANAVRCGNPVSLTASATTTVSPPACTESSSISLSATNPINLDAGNSSSVTLTVTNSGNVQMTISGAGNITASAGTLAISASFPITITPGQSANIAGTYSFSGTRPSSVTFTARAAATECGTPMVRTASYVSQLPCPDTAAIVMSATNPLALNASNQAIAILVINNTGNVAITIPNSAGITSSIGAFSPTASFPITISPGSSATVSGTLSYSGSAPASVTFTARGNAVVCGSAVSRTATAASTITRPACSETASISLSGPGQITLNPTTSQAPVALVVANTGNVQVTVAGAGGVSVSAGTYSLSGSFPITIPPGASATISGTYYYSGSVPASATFRVNATAGECGIAVSRIAAFTSLLNRSACNETASVSISATNPIKLNSANQSGITITVSNTGNVGVSVMGASNIAVSRGAFSPASPFPVHIPAGGMAAISGVYSFSGALPASAAFSVTANSTQCGAAVSRTGIYTSSVEQCPELGITVLGVLQIPDNEYPIVLINRSARISITVRNSGTAGLNVTGISAGSRFSFTPSSTLPAQLAPGDVAAFNGTLDFTGSLETQPDSVTLAVYASSSGTVCGSNSTSASIVASVLKKGDLVSRVYPHAPLLNQSSISEANVVVENRGGGNITGSTDLRILIRRCMRQHNADASGSSCQSPALSDDVISVDALDSRGIFNTTTSSYDCQGYKYVRIESSANAGLLPVEDNFANNNDTVDVECSLNKCAIEGPAEIRLPGDYQFSATCINSEGENESCDLMLESAFSWTLNPPPPGGTTLNYENPALSGLALQNLSIHVINTFANGTLVVSARSSVEGSHQEINCSKSVQVVGNPCELQI